MLLLKIGFISIEYDTLILFLIGILIGALVFGFIFLIVMLSTRKKKNAIVKSKMDVEYERDVVPLKDLAIADYKSKIENLGDMAKIFDIAYRLSNDIAALFFPKSKTPILELSMDEVISLTESLGEAFDKAILEDKTLKLVYNFNMTIGFLVGLKDKKLEIKSELKEAKENIFTRLKNTITSKVKSIQNKAIIKYLEWNHIIDRVSMLFINVAAAETYKAFSMKLYHKEMDIDTSIKDDIEINEKEELID